MDGLRMLALVGSIASGLLGALYAAAADAERAEVAAPSPVELTPVPSPPAARPPEPVPAGADVPSDVAALVEVGPDEILDVESGVIMGPLTVRPRPVVPEPVALPVAAARERSARPAPPRPPVGPRLHADPGRHVIATARGMMARNEVVNGSCYRYLSEVFARAGHDHWRQRQGVFSGNRNGPYADLDLIRPGDWLYIVNHPERTPVGTHSVLFVGWEDRASGYARVIEHSGWGSASAGNERGYDVSRTYRIIRPVLSR